MANFMTLIRRSNSNYTRLRCFDLYKLHSWARGLTEFGDGRNQQSTSGAVNAYYVAALMGQVYGHPHLLAIGSTVTSLEILSGTNVVAWSELAVAGNQFCIVEDYNSLLQWLQLRRKINEMEKQTTLDYLDKKLRIAKLIWRKRHMLL
ncbi:hypothetical protein JHK87_033665 [Glycine soja]|nr:hypothetical protein JHK87_033665 [Glycine soja]